MIDCPICHVMNEDMARFCAECGQRLTRPAPAAPQPSAASPLPPAAESKPAIQPAAPSPRPSPEPPPRLHSPLLGADAEPSSPSRPDFNKLRGGQPPAPPAGSGSGGQAGLRSPLLGGADSGSVKDTGSPSASGGHLGLRSPLLGGVDPGVRDELLSSSGSLRSPLLGSESGSGKSIQPPSPRGGKPAHLHSPLLEGDSPNEYDGAPLAKPGRKLKSPLLAGDDLDYPSGGKSGPSANLRSPLLGADSGGESGKGQTSGRHLLRSPLLGGDDEDLDEPPRPAARPAGLRSPILGSAETVPMRSNSAFAEPEEEEDEPPSLRSPLLGAKVPLVDKAPAPKTSRPESGAGGAGNKPSAVPPQSRSATGLPGAAPQAVQSSGAGQGFPPASDQGGAAPLSNAPTSAGWSSPAGTSGWSSPAGDLSWSSPAGDSSWSSPGNNQPGWSSPADAHEKPPAQALGSPRPAEPEKPVGPFDKTISIIPDKASFDAPKAPDWNAAPFERAGAPPARASAGPSERSAPPTFDRPPAESPAAGAFVDSFAAAAEGSSFERGAVSGQGGILGSSLTAAAGPSGAIPTGALPQAQSGHASQQQPPVSMSGLRGMTAGAPGAAGEEDSGSTSKKRRFKLLEETEPQAQVERPGAADRFGGSARQPAPASQGAALPGFAKLTAAPLAVAAILKVLVAMDYMNQHFAFIPYVADQFAQAVVCICLIVIFMTAGNTRG